MDCQRPTLLMFPFAPTPRRLGVKVLRRPLSPPAYPRGVSLSYHHRPSYLEGSPLDNILDGVLKNFDNILPKIRSPVGGFSAAANPRFDVQETDTAYELFGEVPGAERKDISIDFDDQVLVIRGRVDRSYDAGTTPRVASEDTEMSGALADQNADQTSHEAAVPEAEPETEKRASTPSHQATVSDEDSDDEDWEKTEKEGDETQRIVTPAETPQTEKAAPAAPTERYWHRERYVGEFQRSFSFASRIDSSAVVAKLANGILHITVPKAVKRAPLSITIE